MSLGKIEERNEVGRVDADARRMLKEQYRLLYAAVSEALFHADPIGLIEIGAPRDEYDPEVTTILPRLREATGVDDVRRIVHQEFVRWFNTDIAGPPDRYTATATLVWQAWLRTMSSD
jgi:hypothetical protein